MDSVVPIILFPVAFALAAYLLLITLAWRFQHHLLYRPRNAAEKDPSFTPAALGLAFEDLRIRTRNGAILHAWYVPCEGAAATVLFCHGNKGDISGLHDTVDLLHSLNVHALLFDYRGYGRSSGKTTEIGTYRDVEACWRWLTEEKGTAPEKIILYGRSLGAAVAIWLAARTSPAGLVMESPFTSLPEIGARRYPWLPVRWLSRFRYTSIEILPRVRVPLLIAHSPDDELIPYEHAERLHALANNPKFFVRLTGRHPDGFILSGPEYRNALAAFFFRVLERGPKRLQ